jgi:hypothetical protein
MDTIGTGFYGDGSLLYPGKKVGIDGPVSSLRLEVLRDGLEAFDYLAGRPRTRGGCRRRPCRQSHPDADGLRT